MTLSVLAMVESLVLMATPAHPLTNVTNFALQKLLMEGVCVTLKFLNLMLETILANAKMILTYILINKNVFKRVLKAQTLLMKANTADVPMVPSLALQMTDALVINHAPAWHKSIKLPVNAFVLVVQQHKKAVYVRVRRILVSIKVSVLLHVLRMNRR